MGRAFFVGKCNLRIQRRAVPTECRMERAAAAAAEVHRRSEAVGDLLLFREIVLTSAEKRELGLGQSRDGRARARGSAAHPRIPGCGRRIDRGWGINVGNGATDEETDDRYRRQLLNIEFFHGHSFFGTLRLGWIQPSRRLAPTGARHNHSCQGPHPATSPGECISTRLHVRGTVSFARTLSGRQVVNLSALIRSVSRVALVAGDLASNAKFSRDWTPGASTHEAKITARDGESSNRLDDRRPAPGGAVA